MTTKPLSPAHVALLGDAVLAEIGFDVDSPALHTITAPADRARLLRLFRDGNANSAHEIRDSLLDGDHSVARDVLHKLMGTTATVGLTTLHRYVIEVQAQVRERPDQLSPEMIDRLTNELDRVVEALAGLD